MKETVTKESHGLIISSSRKMDVILIFWPWIIVSLTDNTICLLNHLIGLLVSEICLSNESAASLTVEATVSKFVIIGLHHGPQQTSAVVCVLGMLIGFPYRKSRQGNLSVGSRPCRLDLDSNVYLIPKELSLQ